MIALYKFSVIKQDKEFYNWAMQNKTRFPFILQKGKVLMSQQDIELLYKSYCIALKKAFKSMFYGVKTSFVDLLDFSFGGFETLYLQGREISIDAIGGCECFRINY